MELRPYQVEAVRNIFTAWEESRAVLGVAATDLGKDDHLWTNNFACRLFY